MESKTEGNKLFSQGKKLEAVTAYTKGIDLVEDGGEDATQEDKDCLHLLYSNRSMAHLDLCLVDEAMQDAECAIDAKPDYAKAYARRAIVLLDLFKNKEALVDLDKAEALDPTLDLSEERQRALGKVWVHNAYLKRQLELRKEHKCDYVLQIEYEGEELVEPRWIHAENYLAKRQLASFIRTGGEVVDTDLMGTRGNETKGFIDSVAGVSDQERKIFNRVGDEKSYLALVREQLRSEFGPHFDFEPLTALSTAPSSDRYLFLPVMNYNADHIEPVQYKQTNEPVLFPGRPRWFQPGEPRQLFEASQLLSVEPFPGEAPAGTLQDFEVFAERFRRYRENNFGGNEKVCTGCQKVLQRDDEHRECICCAPFCSWDCHKTHQLLHTAECVRKRTNPENSALFVFSRRYWSLVLHGALPFFDEPLTTKLWGERNITAANTERQDALEAEVKFCVQEDGSRMDRYMEAVRKRLDIIGMRQAKWPIAEALGRWGIFSSTILLNESCARIVAKYQVFLLVNHRCVKYRMPLFHFNARQLADKFLAFMQENRRDDPNFTKTTWLLGSFARGEQTDGYLEA